jgi:hypothetical protein
MLLEILIAVPVIIVALGYYKKCSADSKLISLACDG